MSIYVKSSGRSRTFYKSALKIARIESGSMLPIVRKGEFVVLKRVAAKEVRAGDLVGFTSSHGTPLIHRLMRKKVGMLQTIAEINHYPDPVFPSQRLIGKVVFVKISNKWKRYDGKVLITALSISNIYLSRIANRFSKKSIFHFFRRLVSRIIRMILEIM